MPLSKLTCVMLEGLNAWEARELGRLIHRFGGSPVGSFMQPPARPIMPSMSHALFFDQTHDNESPISASICLVHCGAKKTAPVYFCNNFAKTFCSEIIIGTYILK